MKALILAGGRGFRLNKFTGNRNKSMIKIFEKPLIEYNLEQTADLGIEEIIVVVGYRANEIKKYIGEEYKGIKVVYVHQKKQKGLVNAIESAKSALGSSDFVLMLADEIALNARLKGMLKEFQEKNLFAVCGIVFEKDKASIGKTYSAMTDRKGRVFRLVEKPRFPVNNIKGTGHCILKNEILDYIEKTPLNMNRKEKEMVDLIQCAVDEGKKVHIYPVTKNYANINTAEDLESAKEMIRKNNPKVLIFYTKSRESAELSDWLTKRGIRNDLLHLSPSNNSLFSGFSNLINNLFGKTDAKSFDAICVFDKSSMKAAKRIYGNKTRIIYCRDWKSSEEKFTEIFQSL